MPQFGTPRSERGSYGGQAAKLAEKLGWDLMPWQRHVLDVALEHDENGDLVYDTVILLVPRQSGKSSLILVVLLFRLLFWTDQNVVYAAQELKLARKKWKREMVPRLRKVSALSEGPDYKVVTGSGSESIEFLRTNGYFALSATGEESGHGDTLHVAVVDEAFAHRTDDVDQSFLPTMATVWCPQMWITSTAGTYKSAYLNSKRDIGRAAVERGDTEGVCHFEWVAPDDCDHLDRDVWRATMPALGITISEKRIAGFAAAMKDPLEFRRAFLNQTKKAVSADDQGLDLEAWEDQGDSESLIDGRFVVGVAMPPSRSHTSLCSGGARVGGGAHVEFVDGRPGSGWVIERLEEIQGRWGRDFAGVAVDSGGPAQSLIAGIEAAGLPLIKMSGADHAAAAGDFHDRTLEGSLWHRGQSELDGSVAGATRRPLGDRWVWDRRTADSDVSPLEAATLALGGFVALPEEESEYSDAYGPDGFEDW